MPRLLIVDDDPGTLQLCALATKRLGYTPLTADGVAQAWLLLEQQSPDVILTGYRMPHVTGIEFIEALRAQPAYAALPIILMTANSRPEIRQQAHRAGATDFLAKPFRLDTLRETLARVLPDPAHIPTRR